MEKSSRKMVFPLSCGIGERREVYTSFYISITETLEQKTKYEAQNRASDLSSQLFFYV